MYVLVLVEVFGRIPAAASNVSCIALDLSAQKQFDDYEFEIYRLSKSFKI